MSNQNIRKISNNNKLNNFEYQNSNNNFIENYNISELTNSLESSLSIDIYEKNISLLNEKIKEQQNNIEYLNNRLKNYDITLNEITQLNMELNRLNEIIRNKNKTIQEFRDISDLSKQKFEELVEINKNLIQKINTLESENKKLINISKKSNNEINNDIDDYSNIKLKKELEKLKIENHELKNQIQEKNEEINELKRIHDSNKKLKDNSKIKDIENLKGKEKHNLTYSIINIEENNNNKDFIKYRNNPIKIEKYINDKYFNPINRYKGHSYVNKKIIKEGRYIPLNKNRNNGYKSYYKKRGGSCYLYNKDFSMRTEPSYGNINILENLQKTYDIKDNNNYFNKKSNNIGPLDYSNILLNNLHNKINNNFI